MNFLLLFLITTINLGDVGGSIPSKYLVDKLDGNRGKFGGGIASKLSKSRDSQTERSKEGEEDEIFDWFT